MILCKGARMNLVKHIHEKTHADVLTLDIINSVMTDKTPEAKKQIIKRACQKGELIRVKNGIYVVGDEWRKFGVDLFSVANYMVRPSYISLESALSYYNLIPEAVYTTTSVTTKLTSEYESALGIFSFSHLKLEHFNFGFYQQVEKTGPFLNATPLKALMDYIYLHNKNYDSVSAIEEDLRFDWNRFIQYNEFVNKEKIQEFKTRYKSYRMKRVLSNIGKKL
jgi:hypothetical protein